MSCWETSSNELATVTTPTAATSTGYLVSTAAGSNSASNATLTKKESTDSDNVYCVQSGTIFKIQKEPYTPPPSSLNESELAEQYSGVLASQAPVTLIPTVYEKDNKIQYEAIVPEGTLFTLYLANNEERKLFKAEKNDSLEYDPTTNSFTVTPGENMSGTLVISPAEPQLIVVLTYYFSHQTSENFLEPAIKTHLKEHYPNEFSNITAHVLEVPGAQTPSATDQRMICLSVTIHYNTTVKPSDIQTVLQDYFNSLDDYEYNVLPPPGSS